MTEVRLEIIQQERNSITTNWTIKIGVGRRYGYSFAF